MVPCKTSSPMPSTEEAHVYAGWVAGFFPQVYWETTIVKPSPTLSYWASVSFPGRSWGSKLGLLRSGLKNSQAKAQELLEDTIVYL